MDECKKMDEATWFKLISGQIFTVIERFSKGNLLLLCLDSNRCFIFVLPSIEEWSPSRNYWLMHKLQPVAEHDIIRSRAMFEDFYKERSAQIEWVMFATFPPWKHLLFMPSSAFFKKAMQEYVTKKLCDTEKVSIRELIAALEDNEWEDNASLFATLKAVDESAKLPLYHGTSLRNMNGREQYGIFFSPDVRKAQVYGAKIMVKMCPPNLVLPVLDHVAYSLSRAYDFNAFGIRNLPKVLQVLGFSPEFVIASFTRGIEVVLLGESMISIEDCELNTPLLKHGDSSCKRIKLGE